MPSAFLSGRGLRPVPVASRAGHNRSKRNLAVGDGDSDGQEFSVGFLLLEMNDLVGLAGAGLVHPFRISK